MNEKCLSKLNEALDRLDDSQDHTTNIPLYNRIDLMKTRIRLLIRDYE